MFYLKLAAGNLRKNRQSYLPFLLAMIFLTAVNTVTQLIVKNEGMEALPSADSARQMFGFGGFVIIIFSVIFSFYTNSFLLKQRKKELGLYNVLGLGKKELYQMVFWETCFSYMITTLVGGICGAVFGKFSFLVLRKLIGSDAAFKFKLEPQALLFTALGFALIYFCLFLVNCWQIRRTDPIELLRDAAAGEKEPKTRWISALLGVICLGVGYYLAITIKSPVSALMIFFIAVVLVIIGTYCLFDAGSIVWLKTLRKNKRFYYQPEHFINVSSMIYRMKQNAAGLASICILSTMVLVTVATTASLYFGEQNQVDSRFTHDVQLETTVKPKEMEQAIQKLAAEKNLTLTNDMTLESTDNLLFTREGNHFSVSNMMEYTPEKMKTAAMLTFISLAEYQKLSGDKTSLADNEVLTFLLDGKPLGNTIQLANHTFSVKKELTELPGFKKQEGLMETALIIMKNDTIIKRLLDEWYQTPEFAKYKEPQYFYGANIAGGTEKERLAFGNELTQQLSAAYPEESAAYAYTVDTKDLFRESIRIFDGGFFFLGIMFGLTFMLATALIIYYKQVSEGLDDERRFDTLQKVGMSHDEVKKVIRSQIKMVFSLPLLAAILHLGFAFPLIRKLLLLFGLTNWKLFLLATLICVLIFTVLYYIVYRLTARTYYRIVERT